MGVSEAQTARRSRLFVEMLRTSPLAAAVFDREMRYVAHTHRDPPERIMSLPVVYIDDEPMLCRAFKMIFVALGIPHVTFTDSNEALAYLETNDAVAVFCDRRMPTIDGIQVLEALRRKGRTFPFYLVSGDLDPVDASATPGLTGMLEKPFHPEALLALIEGHVRSAR